jgi:long-subunit acyl-CoA synthetase (AMP-forming)
MPSLADIEKLIPPDAALRDYLAGFLDESSEIFVTYFDFMLDKSIIERTYTRKDFLAIVLKAVNLLHSEAIQLGDCIAHHVTGNRLEDLIIRAACVFIGCIPVTINWQADTEAQTQFKISSTSSKIIFIDDHTPHVDSLRADFPSVPIINVKKIYEYETMSDTDLLQLLSTSPLPTRAHDRCIIFTSGTTGNPKGVRLTYSNYLTNRQTFESFLNLNDLGIHFRPFVVNPMHHTNSTSMTGVAMI